MSAGGDGDNVFFQKSKSVRISFSFEDGGFVYNVEDRSFQNRYFINYRDINMIDFPEFSNHNYHIQLSYVLTVIGGSIFSFMSRPRVDDNMIIFIVSINIFAIFVIWVLARLGVFSQRFSLIPVHEFPPGSFGHHAKIVKDSRHDAIVARLKAGWAQWMRAQYGDIDFQNNPAQEIAKFRWLHERGVINDNELSLVLRQLEANGSSTLQISVDGSSLN